MGKKLRRLLEKEVIKLKSGKASQRTVVYECPFRHKALNESGIEKGPCLLTLNKQGI